MKKHYLIYGELVPGWTLVRAMKDLPNMNAGDWGLVFTNLFHLKEDFLPSFVFNKILNDLRTYPSFDEYSIELDKFEEHLKVDVQIGFAFYNACLEDGFDPVKDDFYIYIAHKLYLTALNGQGVLSESNLKKLLNIFLSKEDYEKAALIRDKLAKKEISKIF